MDKKLRGVLQLILAILALVFVFVPIMQTWNLPMLLIVLAAMFTELSKPGAIQLTLAGLALIFAYMPITAMEYLPMLLIAIAFIVTAAYQLMAKK